MPQSASATVSGWEVDWCAPVACNSTQTYPQGMAMTTFKSNANKSNCTGFFPVQTRVDITQRRGGYLNPPDGLWTTSYWDQTTVRWTIGEPVWCSNNNTVVIPMRYFAFSGGNPWNSTAGSYSFGHVSGEYMSVTCLGSTGTTNTWKSNAAASGHIGSSGTMPANGFTGSAYDAPGARQAGSAGWSISTTTGQVNGTGSTGIQGITFFNNTGATGCSTILNITMNVATDTIGAFKTVQWAGARAFNGVPNTWSLDDITDLNCNVQNPPIECIGQGTTPYLIACNQIDLLAIDWGKLVECVVGTPDDYIAGISFLDEELDMPLPGTGPCSPWTLGTIFDVPFTLDLCGWYPAARPTIDLLMTASLWIAVIASVFRTRAGTNE